MKIVESECKSALVKSKLPDTDYVVNPYTGCAFGCLYCYASFMGRYVGEAIQDWGEYVYVKTNIVEILKKELAHWPSSQETARVLLSSVTDPYQGAEARYKLTRGILESFVEAHYKGLISILTKSRLVLRDIDVLQQLRVVEIGLTVTTTDNGLSRFLEVRAPLATQRVDTLKRLRDAGLPTYAFVGPLLPHFRHHPELLDELFRSLADAGVGSVFVEHINLPAYIRERMGAVLDSESEEDRAAYEAARTKEHREALEKIVQALIHKYGLKLRLSQVLYHPEDKGIGDKRTQASD